MYTIFLTVSLPHTNMLPANIITQYTLISKSTETSGWIDNFRLSFPNDLGFSFCWWQVLLISKTKEGKLKALLIYFYVVQATIEVSFMAKP